MAKLMEVIVCCTPSNGIGYKNAIPWRLSGDMKHFARITTGQLDKENRRNAVLMGRNTWESIPKKFRPLKNRINVVLSSQMSNNNLKSSVKDEHPKPDYVFSCLLEAYEFLSSSDQVDRIFVIGGARVYGEALKSKLVKRVFLTQLEDEFECDVFFPLLDTGNQFFEVESDEIDAAKQEEKGIKYRYIVYERK